MTVGDMEQQKNAHFLGSHTPIEQSREWKQKYFQSLRDSAQYCLKTR